MVQPSTRLCLFTLFCGSSKALPQAKESGGSERAAQSTSCCSYINHVPATRFGGSRCSIFATHLPMKQQAKTIFLKKIAVCLPTRSLHGRLKLESATAIRMTAASGKTALAKLIWRFMGGFTVAQLYTNGWKMASDELPRSLEASGYRSGWGGAAELKDGET